MTTVAEVMTRELRRLAPQDSMAAAARAMREQDIGVVPVCEGERLVGLVTDRDLVVRGIADGCPPESTPLDRLMSRELQSCFEDQSVDEVLERMRVARVRRLPVLDRDERLVGMLSLGDVALRSDGDGAAIVLQEVSEPTAPASLARSPDADADADADADEEAEAEAGSPADTAASDADTHPRPDARPDDGRWADRGVAPRTDGRRVWVLVADEAIARILRKPEVGDELESVEELTDPSAHAKEGEMHHDAQGRRSGSATHSARPNTPHRLRSSANVTSSAGEDQQHLEAQSFARRVAHHLGDALRQHRFDELRIVAAPRFLGHLRKELDAHVRATVTEEINKDLVQARNSELTQRLFPPPQAADRDDETPTAGSGR